MIRCQVISSDIASVGYANGVLEIQFHSGGIYQYDNVPESIYHLLKGSAHPGIFFNENIKPYYHYTRVK